nr:hypothetical protein [Streptomyces griseus]
MAPARAARSWAAFDAPGSAGGIAVYGTAGRGGARDYLLPGVGRAGAAGLLTAVVRVLVRVRGPRRPT